MKAYLSHESALEFWNFPLAQQFFARHITLAGGGGPQYTVLHKHDIFVNDTVPTHLCSLKLTKDSFVVINKVHVVSPKFMFVQLVNGQPADRLPKKHTVNVEPGKSYSVLLTAGLSMQQMLELLIWLVLCMRQETT